MLGESYSIRYIAGVMALQGALGITCESSKTVGEFQSYLLNRADPSASVGTAVLVYLVELKCRLVRSNRGSY